MTSTAASFLTGGAAAYAYGWFAYRALQGMAQPLPVRARIFATRLALRQAVLVLLLWGSWHFLGATWPPMVAGFLVTWMCMRAWLARKLAVTPAD